MLIDENGELYDSESLLNEANQLEEYEFHNGVWLVTGAYLCQNHEKWGDEEDTPLVYYSSPYWLITMNHGPHEIQNKESLDLFLSNPSMIDPDLFSAN